MSIGPGVFQLNADKTKVLVIPLNSLVPRISAYYLPPAQTRGTYVSSLISLCFEHVRLLTRSCYFHLRNIAKHRFIVTKTEMETLIHAFISSPLDYCNALFTYFIKSSQGHFTNN